MTDEEIDAIERACNKGLYGYPAFKLCAELRRRSEEANRSRIAAERERDEARENLREYRSRAPYEAEQWQKERTAAQVTIDTLMRERDEARAEIARLTGGAGQSAQDPFDHATDVNPPKHAPETVVGSSSLTSNTCSWADRERSQGPSPQSIAESRRLIASIAGMGGSDSYTLAGALDSIRREERDRIDRSERQALDEAVRALTTIQHIADKARRALTTIRKLVPNIAGEIDD